MEIRIFKKDEKIYFSYNAEEFELQFDNINKFIDVLVMNQEENVETICDSGLENYKALIDSLYAETKKPEFIEAVKKATEIKSAEDIEKDMIEVASQISE